MIPPDALAALAFYLLGASSIVGAVGLIFARSMFHSALFLVFALGSVAGVFVILGADFLGAVQVLIYVGAVMVLILFGIMLTPQTTAVPNLAPPAQATTGTLLAIGIFLVAAGAVLTAEWPAAVGGPVDIATAPQIATSLFSTYLLPFEIASVLLLVAMIGAIVLAREE